MRVPSTMRIATLGLLVGGLACAKNRDNEAVGAARDTTTVDTMARDTTMSPKTTGRDSMKADSANPNQSKSGVTDTKTGESTIPNATKTRPDQGQPVTSKGDTINNAVDSSASNRANDSSATNSPTGSSASNGAIDSSAINREPTPSTTRQHVVDTAMTPQKADSSAGDSSNPGTSRNQP